MHGNAILNEYLIAFFEERLGPPKAGFIKATCQEAGITEATYRQWMLRGEKGEDGDELYVDFYHRVSAAIAKAAQEQARWFYEFDRKFWALSGPGHKYFVSPTQRVEMEGHMAHDVGFTFIIKKRPEDADAEPDDGDPD